MFWTIGTPKSLANVRAVNHVSPDKTRSNVPIVAIDDEGFPYLDILRGHDYNIRLLDDINDIKALKEYAVVLCDIRGVGKTFKSKFEGAHILAETRKFYPEKILIAYTGQQFDATFNKYFQICDAVLKKDIDSDQWIENLDRQIENAVDPVRQWKKVRDRLLDLDVSLLTVLKLEQAYISAIEARSGSTLVAAANKTTLSQDAKTIVINLASSLVFKLLGG